MGRQQDKDAEPAQRDIRAVQLPLWTESGGAGRPALKAFFFFFK